jgi:hypothetical protein
LSFLFEAGADSAFRGSDLADRQHPRAVKPMAPCAEVLPRLIPPC